HLFDRFLALLLGELGVAPVVEHAVVQPILVNRTQFVLESIIENIDDLFLAFHRHLSRAWLAKGTGLNRGGARAAGARQPHRASYASWRQGAKQAAIKAHCKRGAQAVSSAGFAPASMGVSVRQGLGGVRSIRRWAGESEAQRSSLPWAQAQA